MRGNLASILCRNCQVSRHVGNPCRHDGAILKLARLGVPQVAKIGAKTAIVEDGIDRIS